MDTEKIKNIAKEFFQKATFALDINVSEENGTCLIKLKTDEPQMLIGQNGQTLGEIQKLLKLVLKKNSDSDLFVDVDVNNYKTKKNEYLEKIAEEAANEVFLSQKKKILSPMSAYERRVVHMKLSNRNDVKVESAGEEPNRRIVIKPL